MSIGNIRVRLTLAALGLTLILPAGAVATETSDQVSVSGSANPQQVEPEAKSEQELRLYSDFARFADSWITRLNNTHSEGRSKMQVMRDGDRFRARYHLIEKKSVVVRESPSRPGQFCGILRYVDTVYESVGNSKDESLSGSFEPVPGTARGVSEIFQHTDGSWR